MVHERYWMKRLFVAEALDGFKAILGVLLALGEEFFRILRNDDG